VSEDQSKAPILEAIQHFHEQGFLPFTTPGHKMGRGIDEYTASVLGRSTFFNDIPELEGLNDRHMSPDVGSQAEELAAKLVGADTTMFSTNGSSLSAHTVLLTLANKGDTVLFARNMHRSVVAAIILAEVEPVWIFPPVDPHMHVHHGPTPEQVRTALAAHPETKAVMITSPDFYGVAADVEGIANVCHERDIPLFVDAAWGPHFPFHPELPPSAIESGADISVGSIHKVLGGLSQASVINVKGPRVDTTLLKHVFYLFETTSISSLVYGSIDGDRRNMALHGEEIWGQVLTLARRTRQAIAAIPELTVIGPEVLEQPGAAGLDETKLVIDVSGLGMTGMQAADWLWQQCRIPIELADQQLLMGLITPGDTEETVERLILALQQLAQWAQGNPGQMHPVTLPPLEALQTEVVKQPRDCLFGPTRMVPLAEAAGEIAAELISPYPPGIPAIAPGERYTPAIVQYLQGIMEMNFAIPDASDSSLQQVRVVA
jgi:arginine decarboxylase